MYLGFSGGSSCDNLAFGRPVERAVEGVNMAWNRPWFVKIGVFLSSNVDWSWAPQLASAIPVSVWRWWDGKWRKLWRMVSLALLKVMMGGSRFEIANNVLGRFYVTWKWRILVFCENGCGSGDIGSGAVWKPLEGAHELLHCVTEVISSSSWHGNCRDRINRETAAIWNFRGSGAVRVMANLIWEVIDECTLGKMDW